MKKCTDRACTFFLICVIVASVLLFKNSICGAIGTTVIETEGTVVEKKEVANRIYNNVSFITTYSYYLYVQIADNEEEQRVRVTKSYYEGVNENDTVLIDVTVDKDDKIVNVDLSE